LVENYPVSDWLTSKASLKAAICSFVNSADIFNFFEFFDFPENEPISGLYGEDRGKESRSSFGSKDLNLCLQTFSKTMIQKFKVLKDSKLNLDDFQ